MMFLRVDTDSWVLRAVTWSMCVVGNEGAHWKLQGLKLSTTLF